MTDPVDLTTPPHMYNDNLIWSPYYEGRVELASDKDSYPPKNSLAAQRQGRFYLKSFYNTKNDFQVIDGKNGFDFTTSSESAKALNGKPLIFFDRINLNLPPAIFNAHRFFYCVAQPNDPIIAVYFYDTKDSGSEGYGISNNQELKAQQWHEIKVQTRGDDQQYIDLSFQGGDFEFMLYAKSKSGITSNMANLTSNYFHPGLLEE